MTGHETDDPAAARRTTDTPAEHTRTGILPTRSVVVFEAARHECLVCGEAFHLTPANHDGVGVVCPHCGGLN